MKIESNKPAEGQGAGRVSQNIQNIAPPAAREKSVAAPKPAPVDKVNISGKSRELADLVSAVNALPDIREAKVQEVKQSIESGAYSIDPRKIAEKILKDI